MEVDSEGFRVNALDRSHITFVGLNLEPTVFDEFICNIPEKICVDTIEFMKILKRGKKDDILRLEIEEGNLIMTFLGDSIRKFKIRLIDMEYNIPELPNLNPPNSINIFNITIHYLIFDRIQYLNFNLFSAKIRTNWTNYFL